MNFEGDVAYSNSSPIIGFHMNARRSFLSYTHSHFELNSCSDLFMVKICSSKQLVSEQSIFPDNSWSAFILEEITIDSCRSFGGWQYRIRFKNTLIIWSQFELLNSYSESYRMSIFHVNYDIGIGGVGRHQFFMTCGSHAWLMSNSSSRSP